MFSFFCRSPLYSFLVFLCYLLHCIVYIHTTYILPSPYVFPLYSLCIPYVSMCFLPSTHSPAVIYSCYTFIFVLLILYVSRATNVSYQQTTTTYTIMYLSCIYYYYYVYTTITTTYYVCYPLPAAVIRVCVCTTSYCLCVPVGYVLLSVLASFQCSRLRFASRSHYFFLYYSLLTLRIPYAYQIGKVLSLSCRLNVP